MIFVIGLLIRIYPRSGKVGKRESLYFLWRAIFNPFWIEATGMGSEVAISPGDRQG